MGRCASAPRHPLAGVRSEPPLHHRIRTSSTMSRVVRMTNKLPPERGGPNRVQPRGRRRGHFPPMAHVCRIEVCGGFWLKHQTQGNEEEEGWFDRWGRGGRLQRAVDGWPGAEDAPPSAGVQHSSAEHHMAPGTRCWSWDRAGAGGGMKGSPQHQVNLGVS